MSLFKIYNPSVFQGKLDSNNYFEGWYFKHVSQDYQQVLSIIPGISLSSDSHAFIQIINGKSGETHYLEFSKDEFIPNPKEFRVQIGKNFFSASEIILDIDRQGVKLNGSLRYTDSVKWPVTLFSPGIMGWYRFVPYMECYHGVVSVNHKIEGQLSGLGQVFNFTSGAGYIEKDWGTSMPEQWVWLHANSFADSSTALMLSVAKIPWKGKFFVGFLCFLATENRIYRFFTYNQTKIIHATLSGKEFSIVLKNKKFSIEIEASQNIAGDLKAPVQGRMDRYIKESIDSTVRFKLFDRKNKDIASGTSKQAGLEIVGDVISLL